MGMEDMFVSLICRRQKDRSGVLHDGILQLVVPAAACATEPRVISAFTNVAALPRQVILGTCATLPPSVLYTSLDLS